MDDFYWMVGEESSDPVVMYDGAPVRIDQMESTGHFAHFEEDFDAIRSLGVRLVRYGINWRRVQPDPGVFVWDLWDRAFAAADRFGLELVVDLLHFGVPDWLTGVTDPRLPDAFVHYAEAFVARYRQPDWFTPVNEPFITAWFSTGIGIWNESTKDEQTFVRTLAQLCLADLRASEVIRADRRARFLHNEAFGLDESDRANAFRLLSFDFRYGEAPDPVITADVDRLDDSVLAELSRLSFRDGVVAGHDYYPVSAPPDRTYADLARDFHQRYQVPFMVAETSNLGLDPDEGPAWLSSLYEQGCGLRREGLPFVGICWYSRGDQHDWHSTLTRPLNEITPVGLFDIDRAPRSVADTLRALVARPVPPIRRVR